ncbi:MAG: site-specific integrase, partial [Xanthobacteraceae bacterium]
MAVRTMARAKAGTARHSDEALVALYLDMLAAERGAGANTLAAYRHDLEDFSAYLKDNSRSIAKATTDDLRDYLSDLTHRGMQVATVARRLSAMRQLYRFLYAEGHRADDPAAVLQGPKRARSLPKTLTLAEVDHLLHTAATCDPAAPLPVRLRAARLACLVELLYATGLRVSELCRTGMSDLNLEMGVLRTMGKGNKHRLIPVGREAIQAVEAYLANGRPALLKGRASRYLFITARGGCLT